jgi:putative ABC transport system permease protein
VLKMAFRNIFRQKRRSLLTALTMFGGFILTAVAIGFSDGTFNGIVNLFTRSRLGHIQLHAQGYLKRPSLNQTISHYREIGRIIEKTEGVEAWAPRVYSSGLASVGERSVAVRIIGLDPVLENKATNFAQRVSRGRDFSLAASREIILGAELAQSLGVSIGDEVVLVSQGADGSLSNDKYRVVGLIRTGDILSDQTTIYLNLEDARDLLVLDGKIHEMIVIARSLKKVTELTSVLHQRLAAYPIDIKPWQEFAPDFHRSMKANMKGHQVLLLALFIVVAIGVLNTALMAVLERRREFGVLKALGTRPRRIFSLILLEIQLLALMSVVLGVGFSLPINYYLSRHGLPITGLISTPVTFGGMPFTNFTSEVNIQSFVIPAITVIVSVFLVAFFPALKASRTDPAQSMRIF